MAGDCWGSRIGVDHNESDLRVVQWCNQLKFLGVPKFFWWGLLYSLCEASVHNPVPRDIFFQVLGIRPFHDF